LTGLRRAATLERKTIIFDTSADDEEEEIEMVSIPDDRLKLMFTCCHPSLTLERRSR